MIKEKPVGSLERIVYSLKERLSSFYPTDDVEMPDEMIEDKVLDARAILIRDAWRERRKTDPFYYTPYYDCPVSYKDAGNKKEVYATIPVLVDKVPDVIRYVGTNDGDEPYEVVSHMGFNAVEGRQFTFDHVFVMVDSNILRFKNLPVTQDYVRIDAVFYDPRQVAGWDGLVVPPSLIEKIEYIVFNDLISGLQIPKDLKDDAADIRGVTRQAQNVQRNQ